MNINEKSVTAFEQFLWDEHHPGEVLEDFCDEATQAIARLACVLKTDPDLIDYPLSPVVVSYVMEAYSFFRTPLSERGSGEILTVVYSGSPLTVDELVEVARRIQAEIIPA